MASQTATKLTPQPASQTEKDLYEVGEIPPLGHVPKTMHAWAIRRERHGPPEEAMQVEVVPTPAIDSHEVLVLVMAAGVNYNGVWAALGEPISPFDVHKADFHVAGSDASGVVWAVGSKVNNWKVGDEVVIHCNQDDGDDEECNGGDPMFSASQRIWGYETPDGSFAQFARVQARQLMPRAKHLTWEESGCVTLTLATAYRMLFGHRPHILKPGHNVLVWGASGGLGSMATQLCAVSGANAIGVISDDAKTDYVMSMGAKGVINRKEFDCWGQLPPVNGPDFGKYLPRFRFRREARRHGRDLCRHDRLQLDNRRAFLMDASKACARQPLCQLKAGEPGQPARYRAAHRSLHVGSIRLERHSQGPHRDVEKPTPAGQHGRAGVRQISGHAHHRRCHRSRRRRLR
jgi:crotonyl-CoA carboxylase/reductase